MAKFGRLSVRAGGSLLACVALVTGSQVAASAADEDGPTVISVDVTTEGGFSLPSHVHSGLVTFRFTSSENAFHAIQGFYLKPGATLDQVFVDVHNALSGVPELVVEGMEGLNEHIVEIGGAVTSPYGAQEVTIPMEKGTTYWMDLADVDVVVPPRVQELSVVGNFKDSEAPAYSATIEATMVATSAGDVPRFLDVPSTFPHDGTFLAKVTSDELHEFVFRPIKPGVTDQYITDWYDSILAGAPLATGSPWTGIQAGLQSLSPGRWAIYHMNLPPGPYALICYVPSDELPGLPHGWEGMHNVITLT